MVDETVKRNEAGDRYDGKKDIFPAPPPPSPKRAVPVVTTPGFNESGDPIQPTIIDVRDGAFRNSSGDRLDGVPNPVVPPPAPPPARGLPLGAVGFNEAGDPVFPVQVSGLDVEKTTATPPPILRQCETCGGIGRHPFEDRRGFTSTMTCQDCQGTGKG